MRPRHGGAGRRVASWRGALCALALGLVGAVGVARADHVAGQVNTIQAPLPGAQVVVLETGALVRTDSLGRFDLGTLAPGVYSLRIVAVGYAPAAGTVSVAQDGSSAPSRWLLKPLHPDGQGLAHGLVVRRGPGLGLVPDTSVAGSIAPPRAASAAPAAPPGPAAAAPPPPAPPAAATPGVNAPEPAPFAPILGLYLSDEEAATRSDLPGALGELLPQIATSDSLTAVSGGTSEPGAETWRQWGDRVTLWISINPGHPRLPLARRTVAYTRTRLALADGDTWAGYQAARTARDAIALARLDAAGGSPGSVYLDSLSTRLDASFIPGHEPPKPKPLPAVRHRGKHRRSRRSHAG